MPNTYFQFKQFRIEQEKCAMKVCTDSCLFGAWTEIEEHTSTILDIGTGTGLLSLMLAQKSSAHIYGIEIDENACLQTEANFNNSPWKNRLKLIMSDVLNFEPEYLFDFIICNPPFYEKEMASQTKGEQIAKHSLQLNLAALLEKIIRLLNPNGKFAILLPYYRKAELEMLANKHKYKPQKTLHLKQTPNHNYFRYAAVFSKDENDIISNEHISIKDEANEYTYEAQRLLRPYYLYL